MSIEEKKQDSKEMIEMLNDMNHDDLMLTMGFALGVKAKSEAKAEVQPG